MSAPVAAPRERMTGLKGVNLAVMFLLELAVYASVAYWGVEYFPALPAKLVAAIGGVVVLVAVWAVFGAPRARTPARGPWRVLLEVLWFGAAAVALFLAGATVLGVVFVVVYLVNAALRVAWHQTDTSGKG